MDAISLIGIFVALVIGTLSFYKWKFTFWSQRNLPTLPPIIPFGTMRQTIMGEATPGEVIKDLYLRSKVKGYTKHVGNYFFSVPRYMAIDPEIIKCIMQKDFHHFTERGFYYNEKHDPMSANLFTLGGQRWKTLRHRLSPTFTSGKIKMMFETMLVCGDQLVEAVDQFLTEKEEVDIKEIAACYTTDMIGTCAFGLDCNSFKTKDSQFRELGKKITGPTSGFRSIQIIFAIFRPKLARKLGILLLPPKPTAFFKNVIEQTVEFREKNNVDRKDMLKLLIELKNSDGGLNLTEIASQALIFFTAGFETSSTTMTFCLYELSSNENIQEKVREEINAVLKANDGKISYESIKEMKYLHRVVQETLRKYPPLPFITRECVEDYRVPGTDVVIPKGTNVTVPVLGIHHDPEYYPKPDEFDPDRFLPEVEEKRPHFTYLPFGEGPRICIGLRFGYLQTKIGLINLLKNFKFAVNKKTVEPIVFNKFSLFLSSEKGIFLNVEKA